MCEKTKMGVYETPDETELNRLADFFKALGGSYTGKNFVSSVPVRNLCWRAGRKDADNRFCCFTSVTCVKNQWIGKKTT